MNKTDLEKINEELQKEINKNNEQITISDERLRMANVNQSEYKATEITAFSIIPYIGLTVLTGVAARNGSIYLLTKAIPAASIPLLTLGSSLGIGLISQKLFDHKYKVKKRFKSFSKAKTEAEKLQEEVKYTIKLEQAKNRNIAINKIKETLTINNSIIDTLSTKYQIRYKNVPKNKEEARKRVEELKLQLEREYDKLNILTAKKVLSEKFGTTRIKSQRIMNIIAAGAITAALATALLNMPLILFRDFLSPTFVANGLIYTLAEIIITTTGVCGYMIKRNKDYKKAFTKLNNELGENALSEKLQDAPEEEFNLDSKIDSAISKISIIGAELQEQKIILDSLENSETEETDTTLTKEPTNEKTDPNLIDYNPEYIATPENNALEGPSLTRKRPNNPNF